MASYSQPVDSSGHSGRTGKFTYPRVPYTSTSLTTSLLGSALKLGFGNAAYMASKRLGASTEASAIIGAAAAGVPKSKLPSLFPSLGSPPTKPGSPTPNPGNPSPAPVPGAGEGNGNLEYLYADLAKAYGMDASTAYQEALSNTSYQRAVKDLQAAGLNPVLAAGSLSGAGGVYGASQISPDIVSSGVSSSKGLHNSYKVLSNVGSLVGALAGVLFGRSPYAAWTGSTVGKTVGGSIGNLFDSANS